MTDGIEILDVAFSVGTILVLGSFFYLVWIVIKHRDLDLVTDMEISRRSRTKTPVHDQDVVAR